VRRHSGGDYAAPEQGAGSVALVTGANRGIGLAFVRELAARGAKRVYAGVRSPDTLAHEFAGLPAEVVPLDVTDPAAVTAAANAPARYERGMTKLLKARSWIRDGSGGSEPVGRAAPGRRRPALPHHDQFHLNSRIS